jgi:hypothetical protein
MAIYKTSRVALALRGKFDAIQSTSYPVAQNIGIMPGNTCDAASIVR